MRKSSIPLKAFEAAMAEEDELDRQYRRADFLAVMSIFIFTFF